MNAPSLWRAYAFGAAVLWRMLHVRAAKGAVVNATTLRRMAASAIAEGRLPPVSQHRVHARKCKDKRCTCCGKVITAAQIQYDLELIESPSNLDASLHLACYEAWYAAAESTLIARPAERWGLVSWASAKLARVEQNGG
jgi:hypothetical protein